MAQQNFLTFLRAREADKGLSGPTFGGRLIQHEKELLENGFRTAPREPDPKYLATMDEAQRLYDRVLSGNRWAALMFEEAMTMSDFSGYFGDILDRSILAAYAETPYTWRQYAKAASIKDFRQAKLFRFDRGASVLDGPILPNSYGASGSGPDGLSEIVEYPQRYRVETNYVDQLFKFGARMDFSWETLVNDDLDALRDTPALFGRAARRTEEKRVTQLFVSPTGPNATFFSAANKNAVTIAVLPNLMSQYGLPDNPHLSITSLQAALQVMMNQRDLDGEPISVDAVTLVVPPALKIVAMNILNATQVWMNDQGGTIGVEGAGATASAASLQRLLADNWAKNIVKLAVNYYIPVVDSTHGQTEWFLFADPNAGRPALQQSFLRGREGPEMFMKASNSIPIGEGRFGPGAGIMPGGSMNNPMDGDFETDTVQYKIRHVLGGCLLDPIMAVASNGSDS